MPGKWASLVPPFKVVGIDTDRTTNYDFLFVIHSTHWPILYHFWYEQYLLLKIVKIVNFSHPVSLIPPPTDAVPSWNFDTVVVLKKLPVEWYPCQMVKKFDSMYIRLDIVPASTDGRDQRTETVKQCHILPASACWCTVKVIAKDLQDRKLSY